MLYRWMKQKDAIAEKSDKPVAERNDRQTPTLGAPLILPNEKSSRDENRVEARGGILDLDGDDAKH